MSSHLDSLRLGGLRDRDLVRERGDTERPRGENERRLVRPSRRSFWRISRLNSASGSSTGPLGEAETIGHKQLRSRTARITDMQSMALRSRLYLCFGFRKLCWYH